MGRGGGGAGAGKATGQRPGLTIIPVSAQLQHLCGTLYVGKCPNLHKLSRMTERLEGTDERKRKKAPAPRKLSKKAAAAAAAAVTAARSGAAAGAGAGGFDDAAAAPRASMDWTSGGAGHDIPFRLNFTHATQSWPSVTSKMLKVQLGIELVAGPERGQVHDGRRRRRRRRVRRRSGIPPARFRGLDTDPQAAVTARRDRCWAGAR